ncbi:MAG: LLM class F420-dependent oxidoreductase [Gammaproteobacteria bacterium]|nr:LLM class F420-dependent oxidoreductase [Gammaproteobacteria bacterium]
MKLSLQIPRFDWPGSPANIGPTLTDIARTAEAAGLTSLWVMDHFFQMDMPGMGLAAEEPMLESYTVLAHMAAVTRRVRLGTLVTGVNYRHPGHLLKTVTTLDVLSGGRANLGIGAGWYEREAVGLGFPFPPLGQRFEWLEETLQLARHMWRDDPSPFRGRHLRLAEPMNHPQPLSKPHPPILVGGTGERRTLRLVARYADACNLYGFQGVDEVPHKLEVLRQHCEQLGRDYNEIEKTIIGFVALGAGGMSPAQLVDHCGMLAGLGIEHFIFVLGGVETLVPLETIGKEVIPAVTAL